MVAPIQHGQATGIHPGAFVQSSAPDTSHIQDGCLWVDTSSGPPYQLKVWDATAALWRPVGIAVAGVDAGGDVLHECLLFPNGGEVCNPPTEMTLSPNGAIEHIFDATGYTLPGGHRLEVVPS